MIGSGLRDMDLEEVFFDFTQGKDVGSGSFGKVYSFPELSSGKTVSLFCRIYQVALLMIV